MVQPVTRTTKRLKAEKRYILEHFDFEKVRKVMHVLDWKYFDTDVPPSVERLKKSASEVMDLLIDPTTNYDSVGSGGFRARLRSEPPYLQLVFEAVRRSGELGA
jgi:hypothetical protein